MKLPEEFCRRLEDLLGEEYPEFFSSFQDPRVYGLRVNTLKIRVEDFLKISPFTLTPIPWVREGFYFQEEDRPAKHPYYHAGLYYLQEPSAMAPARVLAVEPGDRVLDLCAAPGGKSTQVAAGLQGRGLLVSNDINADRTKALAKNLELFGAVNAVITNETPEKLEKRFSGFFDKILIDAPCSGEGMFRKDPEAVRQWSVHTREKCALMQHEILFHAARMVRPGGRIVYSTCTFAPEENEQMIAGFLSREPDFSLVEIAGEEGWSRGCTSWAGGLKELEKTVRLWPHQVKGEGHFVALLEKRGNREAGPGRKNHRPEEKRLDDYFRFVRDNLGRQLEGKFQFYGDHLYLQPWETPDLSGIKVVRPGLYLGLVKKNRFEPAHSLALALKRDDFHRTVNFDSRGREIRSFLKGETLCLNGEKGWTGVCVDGFPVGWGKLGDGVLKNHYPKGWRRLD